jgi:hypothetical protein
MNTAKRFVNLGMTVALLFLMAYARVGEAFHEALGCAMFALTLAHMALNFPWYRRLGKGRYSTHRIAQTVLNFLILGSMLVSMLSGARLSRHVFASLGLSYSLSASRIAHLLASHWGFCLMSVHLGMHWAAVTASMTKGGAPVLLRRTLGTGRILRGAAWALATYGVLRFISRDFWRYMVLITRFAFFDYEEPLALFLVDHIAVMAFFISLGFLLDKKTRRTALANRNDTLPLPQQD